jgi:hypothetical protein
MKILSLKDLLVLGGTGLMALTSADAATVVTAIAANSSHSADAAYPAFWTSGFSTANDVLLGLTPAATGAFNQATGMSVGAANDGTLSPVPANGDNLPMFAGVGPNAGTQLVFTLAQASYISSIGYFGGWVDAGRSDVNFTVSYSTDHGETYIALIDANGGSYSTKDDPTDIQIGGMNDSGTTTFHRHLGGTNPISNYVNVTDDATTYLGNNAAITNLKFDFGPVTNNWVGLEELTATGVAVPEASVWSLGLAGIALGLLRRRRA